VGLRNSHDKSFPVGIAFGSRVFVCDNAAFIADHVIKRRHTANAKRDKLSPERRREIAQNAAARRWNRPV
jgi:hypothetical protein